MNETNINIVTCLHCNKDIDTSKAATEKEHEYVYFKNKNIYMHYLCFVEYDKSLAQK